MAKKGKIKKLIIRYKFMLAGIAAVTLLYIGVAGIVSATTQWWVGTGDTVHHVDYIWRVHNGDIPKRTDNITYPPFVELGGQKAQIVSANPPLFYALQSPIIGPLLNQGKWETAIEVGRLLNIFIGVLCILVLAWAGWLFGGRRKELFAVAVPALSVMTYRFTRLNFDYAIDALLVLFTTLSIIYIHKLLRNGPQIKYVATLALLAVLGMATKAPYIVFLAVTFLAIIAAYLLYGEADRIKSISKGTVVSAGIFILMAIAIGWFYYLWNYKAYGGWFSAREPGYTGGREVKSFGEVIISTKLWGILHLGYAKVAAISVAITSVATAGVLLIKTSGLKRLKKDKPMIITASLMLIATAGIFATQVEHAVGVGAYNFRYMLPAILPISLFLAYGLLEFKRARGQLIALAVVITGYTSVLAMTSAKTLTAQVPQYAAASSKVGKLLAATSANGLPNAVLYSLLVCCVAGSALLAYSLFMLTKSDK